MGVGEQTRTVEEVMPSVAGLCCAWVEEWWLARGGMRRVLPECVQDRGVLITAAEEVMNMPTGVSNMQPFLRGANAGMPGSMVRPEQPALQLSYAGHQISIDADF